MKSYLWLWEYWAMPVPWIIPILTSELHETGLVREKKTARSSFTVVLMQAASTPELCHMRSGRSSAGRWGNRSASAPVPHHQKVNVALIADQRTNPSPTAQYSVKPPVSASSFRAPGHKQLPPQQCASLPAGPNIFLACENWEISAGCERPQPQTSHSHVVLQGFIT
ncbi:uncharacterized protein LOC142039601 isoform X2 [Buteo buteo]|uniref:uncharacterized protein LOC142039601 isoform X2 n=1 Tax=Buteo buteo TaxID=30397 RepID=UPI003EB86521